MSTTRAPSALHRLVEVVLFWGVPATLALTAWGWTRLAWVTPGVLVYLLLTPAIAMTINVAVGAGWLRMWRFNLPYAVTGVVPQIGLIYAAVVNLLGLSLSSLIGSPGVAPAIAFVLLMGIGGALLGVGYDLLAVHYGFLEVYVPAWHKRQGTWAVVRSYGFQFFGVVGVLAGLSAQLGYALLVAYPGTPWFFVLALGVLILVVPCVSAFAWSAWTRKQRALRRAAAAPQGGVDA